MITRHTIHVLFFFFNDTATTEIYTLSLHDALPICLERPVRALGPPCVAGAGRSHREPRCATVVHRGDRARVPARSEEHTSELQSRQYLVCRLLLEKKKKTNCLKTQAIARKR